MDHPSIDRRKRSICALGLTLGLGVLAGQGCAGRENEQQKEQQEKTVSPSGPVGHVWEWTRTTGPAAATEVPEPERYTLNLLPDRKALIRFDCNRGGGSYEMEESRLSFGPLVSTLIACPEDSLDDRYMEDLKRVVAFRMRGEALELELADDSGTMAFRLARR
jgi:heat shock protein HslJ